jgi:Holliday junction resolvasome RuvABC endonuclease subunit
MSLDISTKATGVAIFDDDKLVHLECITPKGEVWDRISVLAQCVTDLYLEYKPDVIVTEEPEPAFVKNNIDVYRKLTIAHGAIILGIHAAGGPEVRTATASHWRKLVGIKTGRGIKREMLKKESIRVAKELYPTHADEIGLSDDKADAVLIGRAYINEHAARAEKEYNWEE